MGKKEGQEVFRLNVDYRKSLKQMVAAGCYDQKEDGITVKHFSPIGKGIIEFEARYFHFHGNTFPENLVKRIEQADKGNSWLPAKIEHLLQFGAAFPEEQRKFPIIGLGSVAEIVTVRGMDRYVPVLNYRKSNSKRALELCLWPESWWDLTEGFLLAVRRVSAS